MHAFSQMSLKVCLEHTNDIEFTQLTALAQRLHTFNIPLRSHTRVHDRRLRSSLNADFKERAHPIGTAGELA
ncbi:Hypothetical predicted protein [Cloeon dipterum]|uniref:Uncharacterized protein n=1 Tax=Cloeon dipterum TaxID=197152 RepID=A0A8S1DGL7_9INSE|nr:Hypothetical predicted protein [Cloeon dipterum]